MSRWKALIVDNEAPARDNLLLALSQHPDWLCVDACSNSAQALENLQRHPVDLLLLDIHMPGKSGLQLAAEASKLPNPPAVVFVTADDGQALRAFDVYAVDYLLKPFDDQRFASMLAHVQHRGQARHDASAPSASSAPRHIQVRSVGSVSRVAVANICWVRAAGNYVELHLHSDMVLHRSSLEAMAKQLPPDQFLRVHRAALVRTTAISALSATGEKTFVAELTSGMTVPVSERYVGKVRQLFAKGM